MVDYAELVKALRCCSKIDARNNGCDSCPYEYCGDDCQNLCGYAADAIEELLSAVPKRGEWITTRTWEHDGEPYCSICGFEQSFARFQKFKYCPRCGAKMEVGE